MADTTDRDAVDTLIARAVVLATLGEDNHKIELLRRELDDQRAWVIGRLEKLRQRIRGQDHKISELDAAVKAAERKERTAWLDAEGWKTRAQAAEAMMMSHGIAFEPTPRQVYEATR